MSAHRTNSEFRCIYCFATFKRENAMKQHQKTQDYCIRIQKFLESDPKPREGLCVLCVLKNEMHAYDRCELDDLKEKTRDRLVLIDQLQHAVIHLMSMVPIERHDEIPDYYDDIIQMYDPNDDQ